MLNEQTAALTITRTTALEGAVFPVDKCLASGIII